MTYQDLKNFLETLTPEQLNQKVVVINGDDEDPILPEEGIISEEDIYWYHHGGCLGTLKEARQTLGDEFDEEDLIICPKGTVTLNTDI